MLTVLCKSDANDNCIYQRYLNDIFLVTIYHTRYSETIVAAVTIYHLHQEIYCFHPNDLSFAQSDLSFPPSELSFSPNKTLMQFSDLLLFAQQIIIVL